MPYAAGQRLTAGLANPVLFSAHQSATGLTTLTTAVWGTLGLDAVDIDTHNGHSSPTSSDYVIPVDGDYMITAAAAFANNVTGLRGVKIVLGGTVIPRGQDLRGAAPTVGCVAMTTVIQHCLAGFVVNMQGFQASGGNLNTLSNTEAASHLEIALLRRG